MADMTKNAVTEGGADDAALPARRVGLIEFFRQVNKERKKVTWPSWKETWLTTMMVFIMVGITMVFFFFVDLTLQQGEYLLIGAKRLF